MVTPMRLPPELRSESITQFVYSYCRRYWLLIASTPPHQYSTNNPLLMQWTGMVGVWSTITLWISSSSSTYVPSLPLLLAISVVNQSGHSPVLSHKCRSAILAEGQQKYLVSSASLRINRVQKVSWITRPHWIKCICVPLSKGCFTLRVFCKQDHQSEVETYPIVTDDDEADKKGELEPLKVTLDTVGKLYLLPFDTNDQSVCVRVLCSQKASSIVIDRHSKISCLLIS